jgi:ribosomal-protein-serine acetyltransferase
MNPPNVSPTIELTNERLLLRVPTERDVDALFGAVEESIDEVGRWMPWCAHGYSREGAASFIQSQEPAWSEGRAYSFVVFDRSTGQLVSCCGLNHLDWQNRRANLGYWMRRSAWGRGVAPAAARLVAEFGFRELQLDRIEIVAATGNVASQRVAEKVGAVREGIARKRCRVGELTHDAVIFSLVREDLGL